MKRNLSIFASILILTNTAFATDNWRISTLKNDVSLDTVKSSLNKVYDAQNGLLKIYDASSKWNFALTTVTAGKTYIVNANNADNIDDFIKGYDSSIKQECAVKLVKGFNIVSLPSLKFSNTINGAEIEKIYAAQNGILKIYDASSQWNFALTTSTEGNYYIVKAASATTGICQQGPSDKDIVDEVAAAINNRTLPNDTQGTEIIFDPAEAKIATSEDQTYIVNVTVTKGDASATTSFEETVEAYASLENPPVIPGVSDKKIVDALMSRILDTNDTKIIDLLISRVDNIDGVSITYNTPVPDATANKQYYGVNISLTKGDYSLDGEFTSFVAADATLKAEAEAKEAAKKAAEAKAAQDALDKSAVDVVAAAIKDRTLPNDLKGTAVSFDPAQVKTATSEDQTYTVNVTITKGTQSATASFEETVAAKVEEKKLDTPPSVPSVDTSNSSIKLPPQVPNEVNDDTNKKASLSTPPSTPALN